jgi:hypothetical protein
MAGPLDGRLNDELSDDRSRDVGGAVWANGDGNLCICL